MTVQMQSATMAPAAGFLRKVLLADAATGIISAVGQTMLTGEFVRLTGMPSGLLFMSGLALYPIAAFMAWTALRTPLMPAAVWIIILGNVGWALASLALLLVPTLVPTPAAAVLVAAQAAAVAMFAIFEWVGLKRSK